MHTTSAVVFRQEIVSNKAVNAVIGVVFFMLATTLGAYVRIPLPGSPVPITMQTFFAILAGAVLGKRLGLYSQLGYIALGAAGLPIFQNYSFGILYLFGPTGGYLAGFVIAAYFTGLLTRRGDPDIKKVIIYFMTADLLILLCGAGWLACLYKKGIAQALSIGVAPFIAGDIAKVLLVSAIYSKISRRARAIFSS